AERELRLQQCEDCGGWRFPDSAVCPSCLSPRATWRTAAGRGTLWSWVVMHRAYLPTFPFAPPYVVGLVELEEGPLVASRFDLETALGLELPVEASFEAVGERTILTFRAYA